jgi:hypothetical protein
VTSWSNRRKLERASPPLCDFIRTVAVVLIVFSPVHSAGSTDAGHAS